MNNVHELRPRDETAGYVVPVDGWQAVCARCPKQPGTLAFPLRLTRLDAARDLERHVRFVHRDHTGHEEG